FNPFALKRDGVDRAEVERVACEGAMTVPGIARCFTRTQLERGAIDETTDGVARRVAHGFNVRRSGDAVLVQEPYKYFGEGATPTPATHGTPYSYDTHVPLIIMGRGLAPGRYAQAATPADIAPTLANLLRVQPKPADARATDDAQTAQSPASAPPTPTPTSNETQPPSDAKPIAPKSRRPASASKQAAAQAEFEALLALPAAERVVRLQKFLD